MAKKRPLFGVSNYENELEKRPGRHTKNISKEYQEEKYRGQGR